jgi:hypothetical protein
VVDLAVHLTKEGLLVQQTLVAVVAVAVIQAHKQVATVAQA